ncbi:MAG TPA: aldehyde dehydrogenase family protein [Oligoflexia bacterium]|nr:aldehyde dehydrogenase family protein [Oligoflexia bacterium]HMP48099.1 aldehyde dehydrogenase family protein [Oligoflexia bacterium]
METVTKNILSSKIQFDSLMSRFGIVEINPGTWIGSKSLDNAGQNSFISSFSPIDGVELGKVAVSTENDSAFVISEALRAFHVWRLVPAPKRGELIRLFAEKLREEKKNLGKMITLEVGKIPSEAEGEVQELIDVCDLAVGQSRQLYGRTIASERPSHRLMEQWHPIGPVAVITAFNFPIAPWCWNAALAIICGNPVIWKPSEKAPLVALAVHNILSGLINDFPEAPESLITLLNGGKEVGNILSSCKDIPLVCATGSVATGRAVSTTVASRLGRSLLELGGNNAMIVCKSADLKLSERAITFAAVGTAGQRCTTLRRLIVHESIKDTLINNLCSIYQSLKIGSPLDNNVLVGPLIDKSAYDSFFKAIEKAKSEGGKILTGGICDDPDIPAGGFYVKPAIIDISLSASVYKEETFAPILYVISFRDIEEAISIHNNVPQGLSGSIFTSDIREAELFLSPSGSDCGIANVNIGTSGAEIGGAFGGEKETGGGRQAGSDTWKNYMRRTTNTINYSLDLPHAQGVVFV